MPEKKGTEMKLERVSICRKCGKPARLTDGSPLVALVAKGASEPKLICLLGANSTGPENG